MCSPCLKSGVFSSTFLTAEYLHKLLRTVLCRRFVLLPHLFIYVVIYLYQPRLMTFILYLSSQAIHYFLFKLLQLWSLGALSVGFCVPVTYPGPVALGHPLLSALPDAPGSPCRAPTHPGIHHCSKTWFLLLDNDVKNQVWLMYSMGTIINQCHSMYVKVKGVDLKCYRYTTTRNIGNYVRGWRC